MVGTEAVLVVAVVDGDLDGDGSINETDDGSGNADVVGVAAVRSTSEAVDGGVSQLVGHIQKRVKGGGLPSNISHETTTNNKNRLLAVDSKLSHRINNAKQGIHALGLLANHGLVNLEVDAMVVKVLLQLITVQVEDVEVHDCQAAVPARVALCQLLVGDVENAIEELEVILDLLVAAH